MIPFEEDLGALFAEDCSSLSDIRQRAYRYEGAWEQSSRGARGALRLVPDDDPADILFHCGYGGGDLSLCFWYKEEASANWTRIFGFPAFEACQYDNKVQLYFKLSVGDLVRVPVEIQQNEWVFLCFVKNGNQYYGYRNGELVSSWSGGSATQFGSSYIEIGNRAVNRYAGLSVSNTLAFPFALTDEDVQALYNDRVFNVHSHLIADWDCSQPNVINRVANTSHSPYGSIELSKVEDRPAIRFDAYDYVKIGSVGDFGDMFRGGSFTVLVDAIREDSGDSDYFQAGSTGIRTLLHCLTRSGNEVSCSFYFDDLNSTVVRHYPLERACLAFGYDANNNVQFVQRGNLRDERTPSGTLHPDLSSDVTIGAHYRHGHSLIRRIQLYNTALSPLQTAAALKELEKV